MHSKYRHLILVIPLVVLLFLSEMVLKNRSPLAPDYVSHYPLRKWGEEYVKKNQKMPQWYPHLFSGGPSYGGYVYTPSDPVANILRPVLGNLGIRYWFYFSLGGVGMFLFLRRRRMGPVSALFGSLIYALTPYLFGLINAGHGTKIFALGYLPFVLLAVDHALAEAKWTTVLYLGLITALQLWAKHPQIVYYTWMLVVFLWLWKHGGAVVKNRWNIKLEGAQTGFLICALVLSLILAIDPYAVVYQYQGHSTRGAGSVLDGNDNGEKGTSWEYATQWSFHPKEIISFIYPYFYGLQNFPTKGPESGAYWGHMPFTQSTHYLGLLTILLVAVGLAVRKMGSFSLSMVIASCLIVLVGFGKFFPVLFWPLFKFAPVFNKFRIPSMIYAILPATVGIVSAQGLDTVLGILGSGNRDDIKRLRRWGLGLFGAVAGVSLILLTAGDFLGSTFGMFSRAFDSQQILAQNLPQVRELRLQLFQKGALLALVISGGGLAVLWLGLQKTVKPVAVGFFFILLCLVDLWVVDHEFLHLKPGTNIYQYYRRGPEIDFLANDESLFRILPLDDPNSNRYGYFGLSSIAGYRPVKLRTYQDLMDAGGFNSLSVLNMLNVKYLLTSRELNISGFERVFTGRTSIYRNLSVLPKAWMVFDVIPVSTQKESLQKTMDPGFDPGSQAVVLSYSGPEQMERGEYSVNITSYSENKIVVELSTAGDGFLVLSENYYRPGWIATMDGDRAVIYQTNHVLRSVQIPAGEHKVTFSYDTRLYGICRVISRISLALVLLAIVFIHRERVTNLVLHRGKRAPNPS